VFFAYHSILGLHLFSTNKPSPPTCINKGSKLFREKPWHLKWKAKSIKVLNRLMVDHTYDKVFLNRIKVINSNQIKFFIIITI